MESEQPLSSWKRKSIRLEHLKVKRSSFWFEPWECYRESLTYPDLTALKSKDYDRAHLNGNLVVVTDTNDTSLLPLRGWALYEPIGDNIVWLTHIARFHNAVEPGIGSLLIEGVFSEASRKGYDTVILGVSAKNEHAQKFYVKHGFERIGVTFLDGLWLLFGKGPSINTFCERMGYAEVQNRSGGEDQCTHDDGH